jgi:hypothetical protein
MLNVATTTQRDAPHAWLRDAVDIVVLAALLAAVALGALP